MTTRSDALQLGTAAMRSSRTSSMADRFAAFVASDAGQGHSAMRGSSAGFNDEFAAAVATQVFARGLAEMWDRQRDMRTARPIVDLQERRALITTLTERAEALAKRARVATHRRRTAGGFA